MERSTLATVIAGLMAEGEDHHAAQPQFVHIPINIPFPPKLDLSGNVANNWKRFKRVWENYEIASGLTTRGMQQRTATLLTCIGADALNVYDGLVFENEEERGDVNAVLQKFETFCLGQTNETFERFCFNKREQEPHENIDTYAAALRTLARTCNYGELEDDFIRDRIVVGIRDNATRKKLLQQAQLRLQSCMDICRANEATSQQVKTMTQEEVQFVKKKPTVGNNHKRNENGSSSKYGDKRRSEKLAECKYCGQVHVWKKKVCPAWGKSCDLCGGRNHFSVKCKYQNDRKKSGKSKSKPSVSCVDDDSSSDGECVLTVTEENIDSVNEQYQSRIHAVMSVKQHKVKFQLDCGSTVNVLSVKLYSKICSDPELKRLEKTSTTLVMYNNSKAHPVGKRRVNVRNLKNQKKYSVEFLIVEGDVKPILGARAIQQMGLITVNSDTILDKCEAAVNDIKNVPAIRRQPSVNTEVTLDYLDREFSDVFQGEGKLDGKLDLKVDRNMPPVKLPTRKVPLALKAKVKAELDRLTELDIIEPVDTPTDWISSMVVVSKPSGKLRLCIDPKPLNKALKRNHYPTPTIDDILPELSNARVFSVVDAKNGFWHVELSEESSYLTTMGTQWGRYRWKKMPFGISPAPEEFQRRMDEALEGLPGVKVIHDDVIIWGAGENDKSANVDHDQKFIALMERCREKRIKLNREKLKLRQSDVAYMGHRITADGLGVDPEKVKAITNMPKPSDKAGVQRLLGMVTYLQKFAPCLSEITAPLRDLLKKDAEFHWDNDVHGSSLQQVKKILSEAPVLNYFDTSKDTVLQCDASKSGLGACLLQDGHPIAYASRSLTKTEENYAQIEKELLAVVFGMERFESYVYGRKVLVESDHKPLEVICKKSLQGAPKRLQRMLLRLQRFDFEILYKKGTEMYLADALSRAYLPHVVKMKMDESVFMMDIRSETEIETECVNMLQNLAVSDKTLGEIQRTTESDCDLCKLKTTILRGWPESKEQLDPAVQLYFPFREDLSVQNGIIFKGERVVIPYELRGEIVNRVHSSHLGIQGCLRRARESVYWQNMNRDIEEFIRKCSVCSTYQDDQQREPLISHEIPNRPWQILGSDLFEFNDKNYLITVDYYSNFFEVDRIEDKTTKSVIPKLKAHLARHGICDELMTDNGAPYNSLEFEKFMKDYDIEHVTSSPTYAQSNGKAENAVKTAKRIMRKALEDRTDVYLALLDFRNTPGEGLQSSPAQRLFGRRTKTLLPTSSKLLEPKIVKGVKSKLMDRKAKQTKHYNRSAKELSSLKNGEVVRIKPVGRSRYWVKARVEDQLDIRSYQVRTEDGRVFRRNRKHLRSSNEQFNSPGNVDVFPRASSNVQPRVPVTTPVQNTTPLPENQQSPVRSNVNTSRSRPTTPEPVRTSSGRLVRKPFHLKDFVT